MKEIRHREHTESIHVKFKNKQNHLWVIEVKIVTISGGWVLTEKGCKGAFEGDEIVLYFNPGGDYMGVHII